MSALFFGSIRVMKITAGEMIYAGLFEIFKLDLESIVECAG